MKNLRDAAIAGATIILLLYVAITAAKSMADVLQPAAQATVSVSCKSGAAGTEPCTSSLQLARRDN
jgi:hypothetical protein